MVYWWLHETMLGGIAMAYQASFPAGAVPAGNVSPSPPCSGKLKIFFGYAAGVGKTYAMLEAALRARDAGIDVVCGCIDPDVPPATQALLKGLEQLPLKVSSHKGAAAEFDLPEPRGWMRSAW